MAYRLKTIRYKEKSYQILLQNENGPCPLLAAANVLLLKQSISLHPSCKNAGVVTIEELTNTLAEKILTNHQATANTDHHINEVMKIFPNLQYGMDVNPKFTAGPTGVEYTMELNAFDLLSIELVHGWLLEPDAQEYEWVGNNTYNQLINFVIEGNDASAELQKNPNAANHDELSNKATQGSVIHNFLERSGHQLTQFGLQVLHEYVKEGDMVVFFRNNHFNTLTKYEGHLYLLVTDFGYADVSSVVWEKLDVIDGDTEYVTADFTVPAPIQHHVSSAATGEQIVANNLQSNSDYQLALQLSRQSEANPTEAASAASTTTNDTTAKQDLAMEQAIQASLLEHQLQQQQNTQSQPSPTYARTKEGESMDLKREPSSYPSTSNTDKSIGAQGHLSAPAKPPPANLSPNVAVGVLVPSSSQEDRDRLLALQLQQQEEQQRQAALQVARATESASEKLAWSIQQQENARQQQLAARSQTGMRQPSIHPQRAKVGGSTKEHCIIS